MYTDLRLPGSQFSLIVIAADVCWLHGEVSSESLVVGTR